MALSVMAFLLYYAVRGMDMSISKISILLKD